MVEMTRSASVAVLGSEFDNFLFATIGEDKNEIPLSVLSALARLDIDPWQEAAELARVPRATATQRLASSITALRDGPSAHLDPATTAARLIALLPSRARSNIPLREMLPEAGNVTKFGPGIFMYAVFIACILAAQWIALGRQPPAQVDRVQAPTSSTVLPQTSPPNSGE